jgi:hypothetical protein
LLNNFFISRKSVIFTYNLKQIHNMKNQLKKAATILYLMETELTRLESIMPEIEELVLEGYCSDLHEYIDYMKDEPSLILEYAIQIYTEFHAAIAKFLKNNC